MEIRVGNQDNLKNDIKSLFERKIESIYSFETSLDVEKNSTNYFDILNKDNVSSLFIEAVKVYTKRGYKHINGYERDCLYKENSPTGYIEWR